MVSKAARRYATALLEIARERDEVERVLEDIKSIRDTLKGSRELVLFLRSPIINFGEKKDALVELFEDQASNLTIEFLKLLARKNRASMLDQVCEGFLQKYNEYAGIIRVEVHVAYELSEEQEKNLHRALEEKTGKKVDLSLKMDPSLKGGMAVRIDDTVIDGTIKHKLQELEDQLLATAVE